MSDVTRILLALENGESAETSRLLPLVYDELRLLAAQKLAHEKPGHTLQATALVHEAFLRLIGQGQEEAKLWHSRPHFFAAAAEAMRRILIDNARRKSAEKRGGEREQEALIDFPMENEVSIAELLSVDEVLDKLAEVDREAAQLVKLRFFVGLNMHEIADAMQISVRKAQDIWAYARAWLKTELA